MDQTYCYPAIFHYEEDGISICFPDLNGCISCAFSEQDAFSMASDALGLYIHTLKTEQIELPIPSSLENLAHESNEHIYLIETSLPCICQKINQHHDDDCSCIDESIQL